jgi:glucose-1-phosphate thymidylyltransferase
MKGLILAGGSGTRLWPITKTVNKHLLPIHSKPMIYYPLGTLMLAGIREFELISTPRDIDSFERLLGNGDNFGININYKVQQSPNGIAEAFLISKKFIENSNVALILGDNIFHGTGLGNQLKSITELSGAQIFGYRVQDPENYGVVELDASGAILSIEEKPKVSKSNIAIPGIYFYDENVSEIVKSIKPSSRGELEITAVNQAYLNVNKLNLTILERGTVWLDTGTIDSLYAASTYVKVVEERQGRMICCLEEIALNKGWINAAHLSRQMTNTGNSVYNKYLNSLL